MTGLIDGMMAVRLLKESGDSDGFVKEEDTVAVTDVGVEVEFDIVDVVGLVGFELVGIVDRLEIAVGKVIGMWKVRETEGGGGIFGVWRR